MGEIPTRFQFVKPGANANVYSIQSVSGIILPQDITTRVACSEIISVSGVEQSSVTWTNIEGDPGLNYLSCTSNCLTNVFTPDAGTPSIVKYKVCGNVAVDVCGTGINLCDTVTINVIPEVSVSVSPSPPLPLFVLTTFKP